MSKIKTFAKGDSPFFCKNIKEVLRVNDDLKKKIQEIEIQNEKDFKEATEQHEQAIKKKAEEAKAREDQLKAKMREQ